MTNTYKKMIFASIIFVVLLTFTTKTIKSQDPNSQEYKDYTSRLEEYQRSHNEYVLARSNYLKFRTLASEEEAIEKTRTMLVDRDEAVAAYTSLLNEEVNNSVGIDETKISEINIALQDEKDWFDQHSAQLGSAVTLDELVSESREARRRYNGLNSYVYVVFSYLSYGKVYDFHTRLVDIYSDLRTKFEDIRNDTREEYQFDDAKIIRIDNWLLESQSSINRSEEILNNIKADLDNTNRMDQGGHADIVRKLENSRLYMKQATAFMEEVITEIKTKEEE